MNTMPYGIYACLWIIQEQRGLPNYLGPGSDTHTALLDAHKAVESWLSEQKEETLKLEKEWR